MKAYQDLTGNSGVIGYEIFENTIDVQFKNNRVYTYEKRNIGEVNFEVMKALAEAGAGLCGFISKMRRAYLNDTPAKPTKEEVEAAIRVLAAANIQ